MFKKTTLQCLIITTIALFFVVGCSKKNPTAITTGSITGLVTMAVDMTPISGAIISTSPATISVNTDTSGQYIISNVSAGTYYLTATKNGYSINTIAVTVIAGYPSIANIALSYIEWVSIPTGAFKMGSLPSDPFAADLVYEQPQHVVYLDAYQISKYEITNGQYKVFMDSGGYNNSIYWSIDGWTWRTANNVNEPYWWSSGNYHSGTAFPIHPVVGVSWYEADAFCRWAGGHLPTEAQWEKAARGTDSSNYWPWGSVWYADKCNSYDGTTPDTFANSSPVGIFFTGQSPYGIYDMAGNVAELCNDWFSMTYYSDTCSYNNPTGPDTSIYNGRVVRGGSYVTYYFHCRVADRSWFSLGPRSYSVGFRIAK